MSYSIGDIITVTIRALLFGEKVINVLHYIIEVFGADADIETLLDSLETNIVDLLINMQSESLTYVELRIDNLTDTITFDVRSLSQIGANASESEPSYVTVTLSPSQFGHYFSGKR